MKRKLALLGCLVLVAGTVAAVFALANADSARRANGAILTPYEEVPSISNPTGSGDIELTAIGRNVFGFRLRWAGLTGPPLFAHIHLGQKGVNGGVSAFLCGGSTKPPCTQATAGVAEGTITPADIVGPSGQGITAGEWQELVDAIRAGVAYANMHTPQYPGGEIRGQITTQ
jgi:hypothetical protein